VVVSVETLEASRSDRRYELLWYDVFTPTRNVVDLNTRRSNKEHTNTRKYTKVDMWQ